jgi:hypothetical protein
MKRTKRIVLINHTGGPIIKEGELAYTEGGLTCLVCFNWLSFRLRYYDSVL